MAKATSGQKRIKPEKPYPEYPLTAHANGQWFKQVRGKVHFFGVWAAPTAAEQLWQFQKEDLQAGRTPRQPHDNRLTVGDLLNRFLHAKKAVMDQARPARAKLLFRGGLASESRRFSRTCGVSWPGGSFRDVV